MELALQCYGREMKNKTNISILPHEECCGCRGCGDTCPRGCISFEKNREGFEYPKVEDSKCVSCGLCLNSCPEINQSFHPQAPEVLATFAKDSGHRNAGSSGGIFGLLARIIIAKGGKVWGAAFDENLRLKHVSATTNEELKPLLRSKYIQSDTSGIYKIIAQDVKAGIPTLFSGTPCQCNTVRNITGDTELLTTVEVVCHGVPSQDLFDRTITWLEERKGIKIKSFVFRSKYRKALHPQAFTYTYSGGGKESAVNGLHYQFPFYFGFQRYITLRPSCYSCKWAKPTRTADITLGDFWGIEKYDEKLDPKTGISQVILNTDRGKKLFNEITVDQSLWLKSLPIEAAVENNGCLKSPTKLSPVRKHFFESLANEPFDLVVRKFLTPRRKWIFDAYYGLPTYLRKIVRKIMDKRMKYE